MFKTCKKILNTQDGISLIEVIVAASLAVMVSIGVMKIQQTNTKGMIKVKTDSEFSAFQNHAKAMLGSTGNCSATLIDNSYDIDNEVNITSGDFNLVRRTTFNDQADSDPNNDVYDIEAAGTLVIPVGDSASAIPEFPSWALMEVNLFPIENITTGIDGVENGTCRIEFILARIDSITSDRSFGARDKRFEINTSCSKDFNNTNFRYCVDDEAVTTGYWRSISSGTPTDGIEYNYDVRVGGNIITEQHVIVHSDENIKRDEEIIQRASDKISEIGGYSYLFRTEEYPERNYSRDRQLGLMAQEVERILPEAVFKTSNGTKAIRYSMLIPVLVEAHKEQSKKIKSQEQRIKRLEEKLDLIIKK